MKKIFRKAMTVLGSAALIGMTVGAAAAASYPSPFTSNTAIVVGSNADNLDGIGASLIAANLDAAIAGSAVAGVVSTTEGDIVPLDNSGSRIYLNSSINGVTEQFSKSVLPVTLADTTFSGNVDATISSRIYIGGGVAAGADNSNKVIFTKQPKTSNDPVVGLSLGTGVAAYLYNATATFKTINFSHADSEGESITLFGRDFVVSTATDTDTLVLFSSASELNLIVGGANPNPSATVVIDGVSYDVAIVTGTSTEATISVNGDSKEISEGSSKKVGGIDVAVKSVTESSAIDTITASILVGADKLTFDDTSKVTIGSDEDPIDGTKVHFGGTPGTDGMTELTVQVFRTGSSEDAIIAGGEYVDPVFGSFKVSFAGLNFPLDDTENREIITVRSAADKTMTVELTDSDDFTAAFDFAYNDTGFTRLGDESNYTIHVLEMANATVEEFVFLGNEEYGHLLKITDITNNTGTTAGSGDRVKFEDVMSGVTYTTEDTSTEVSANLILDGKTYKVEINGMASDEGTIQITYPTSESADDDTFVVYPTMETSKGANLALYEPLAITLGDPDNDGTDAATTTLRFPDGDGYTDALLTYVSVGNWTLTGTGITTAYINSTTGVSGANIAIGQLTYNISVADSSSNASILYLTDPEGTANIDRPAVVIFEEKDDNNEYHALVVDLEDANAGTGTSGIGVNDVLFSSDYYHDSAVLQSDSDITQDIDWWGTLVTTNADDSDQKYVEISYPDMQVYAQLYIGETGAIVGEGAAGVMTVLDTNVATVANKNLVVVGGSAINSVAAELLGGAYSEAAFTSATGVAAGEFLINSYDRSGKTALLVAGYNAADTEKAVTYLLNNDVDTTVGTKIKGTSATEATVVTA